jgi:hypothetical protein
MNLVRLSISVVHGPAAAVPSEISRALAPNINVMVFMTSPPAPPFEKGEASNSDISIPTWETNQRSVDREDSTEMSSCSKEKDIDCSWVVSTTSTNLACI